MKIKGPANYSIPPTPPEPKGEEGKSVSKFAEKVSTSEAQQTKAAAGKDRLHEPGNFEKNLRDIAKAAHSEGLSGEALAGKVVDSVLKEVLGKDFLSKPEAASLKETITPFVSQDEQLMNKLNSILSRLGNKS